MAFKSKFGNRRESSLLRRLTPWLGISLIVILTDQLFKIAIRHTMVQSERVNVLPFFDLTLLFNNGAAFSFLNSQGSWSRWLFTIIGIVAAIVIIVLLAKYGSQRVFAFSLALIMGGALGNVIDRLAYGHVVDFLLFYWPNVYYFPAFNIADSAITIGVVLLLFDELRRVQRR
jgi:signal peptidase II